MLHIAGPGHVLHFVLEAVETTDDMARETAADLVLESIAGASTFLALIPVVRTLISTPVAGSEEYCCFCS